MWIYNVFIINRWTLLIGRTLYHWFTLTLIRCYISKISFSFWFLCQWIDWINRICASISFLLFNCHIMEWTHSMPLCFHVYVCCTNKLVMDRISIYLDLVCFLILACLIFDSMYVCVCVSYWLVINLSQIAIGPQCT